MDLGLMSDGTVAIRDVAIFAAALAVALAKGADFLIKMVAAVQAKKSGTTVTGAFKMEALQLQAQDHELVKKIWAGQQALEVHLTDKDSGVMECQQRILSLLKEIKVMEDRELMLVKSLHEWHDVSDPDNPGGKIWWNNPKTIHRIEEIEKSLLRVNKRLDRRDGDD